LSHNNKFLFDIHNFDEPDPAPEDDIIIEEPPAEPPAPTFSEEELEAAKASAHAQGVQEGIAQERQSREEKVQNLLSQITENFSSLFAAERYREKEYEEEAVQLAAALLAQLSPVFIEKQGKENLIFILKKTLHQFEDKGEIAISVHPDSTQEIDALFAQSWGDNGSYPRYKIMADNTLETGDCRMEWVNGGFIRSSQATAEAITAQVTALLPEKVTEPAKNAIREDQELIPDQTEAE